MRKFRITILLTIFMSMFGSKAIAHDIEVANKDGVTIYYNWINDNTELAVSYRGSNYGSYSNEYSGDVFIPEAVEYGGNTYSVTSIGSFAFAYCKGLTSVTIPNSVAIIDEEAFSICSGLTSLTIPSSVVFIGSFAFYGCSGLTSIVVEEGNTAYDSRDNCNAIIKKSDNKLILGCNNATIPNTVTSIGSSAFDGCSGLTSVTIPNTVTSIGSRAFAGCSGLTSVTIPKSVTLIYNNIFPECSRLISIVVEDGNTAYDTRDNCNAIIEKSSNTLIAGCQNTIIPNSVTSIGRDAFKGCTGLSSVVIPNGVTSIGYQAFAYCNDLTSVTIPNSVTTIEGDAFRGNIALTSVTIPSSVTSIGNFAFLKCSSLTSIIVEDGNTKYDSRDNCNAIIDKSSNTLIAGCQNTIIPNSVTSIANSAFGYCSGLTSLTIPNSVTSIGNYTFQECTALTSVTIGNGVTSIGEAAFLNCSGLTSMTIGSSVTSISQAAFTGCKALNVLICKAGIPPICNGNALGSIDKTVCRLYVPKGHKVDYQAADQWKEFTIIIEIEEQDINIEFVDPKVKELCVTNWDTNGDGELSMQEASKVIDLGNVFAQNNDIKSFDELRYFKGLISLKATWFYGCYFLSAITIPENVKEIEDLLFYYCHFKSIGVDENNQNYMVDEGVLYNKAKSILVYFPTYREGEFTIPTGVTIINQHAFCGSLLSSVTIPDGVSTIKFRGFAGCQLSSIVIPKSVTAIASNAFSNCSKVSSIVVDEDNNVYDSRDNCNAIIVTKTNQLIQGSIQTVIPQSVTAIGQYSFSFRDLLSIDIPNGVQTIEALAFMGAGLSSVKIPASITSIGSQAFFACDQLKTVTVDGKEPCLIEQDAFPYRAESTLYVPTGCKAAYEAADYWKEFKNIFEIGEAVPITIGKSGKASYCGDKSLDFSFSDEVKAYIATGFDKDEGTIWLTRVKDVPAGVPVLIKGEANKTYDVPVTDSQNSYYTNMFVGNTSGEKIQIQETDGDMMNYYLSGDGTFKSVNKSANIGNNKCYLQLPGTFEAAVTGATETVTVGKIGKASFAAPVDLDFTNVSGLKAFTATGYDKSTKTIWLTRVMKVQKGEGVLLKGDAKDYEIPSAAVQSSYMNMFAGNTSGDKIQVQETSEGGSQTNFYLNGDGAFVSVNGFVNIGNNKCYLELPTSMVSVASTRGAEKNYKLDVPEMIKLPISFRSIGNDGDGTTGIKVQSSMQSDNAYYTLQGQRVLNPGKGLYIHNGKKVVIR